MADLDAAGRKALAFRDRLEGRRVVHFGGRSVARGPLVEDGAQARNVVEVGVHAGNVEVQEVLVAEDFRLAGIGQDDEFVAEIATDRAGVGAHRNSAQAHAREGAQIGREHAVIGMHGAFAVEVEGIGVLHQELARAHGAEARTDLIAELELDMVEVERQVLIGLHERTEDVGNHLLVGRAVEHRTLLAVLDAQHFLAIGVIAAAFLPEFGGLQRRHQELDGAGAVLLLADDGVHLVENALAERQPGIDALGLLLDHARTQHEPVRDDLGLLGVFLEDGQEEAGKAHIGFRCD